MFRTVIVVPTYNEAENMPRLAEQIVQHLPGVHLMMMDDNSPDKTADVCEALFSSRPEFSNFKVVRRTGKRGLGRAYRDGFQRALIAGYDRIFQMDADLSHNPARLPALLEESKNCDLVIGSRYCPLGGVEDWPKHRIWLSKFANWYVHTVARVPAADSTGGFRCWTQAALDAVHLESIESDGYSFQVETLHRVSRSGLRINEVPITFTDRQYGKSKISRAVMFESFLVPWRLRFHPWKLATKSNTADLPEAAEDPAAIPTRNGS